MNIATMTNNRNFSFPIQCWLAGDEYEYSDNPKSISATSLIKSTRSIIANKRYFYPNAFEPELIDELKKFSNKFISDLEDRIAMRIGTAIHKAIELAVINDYKNSLRKLNYTEKTIEDFSVNPISGSETKYTVKTEQRVEKEINGFIISGQFDCLINNELHDIKTTSTFSWSNPKIHNKYITQASIYKWLNPEIITGDSFYIDFIFTDFNKNYALSKSIEEYPNCKIINKKFPFWSLIETQMFIENKLREIEKYWNAPLEEIPCCTDEMLYLTEPVYKYYKSGYKEGKRATKNFKSFVDASLFMSSQGNIGEIIEEKPKAYKCPFCDLTEPEILDLNLEIV